jgi:hypothetical protein
VRRRLPLIIVLALWALALAGVYRQYNVHPNGAGDFTAYHKAALAISQGNPPYIDLNVSMPYLYPPIFAQALAPVVAVNHDFRFAANLWYGFNTLLLAVGIWMMGNWRPGIWLAALLFLPWYQSMLLGQVTVLLFFLAVGGWKAYRADRPFLTGILIALGAWIKIYPGLLLVYFAWKRDWRVVAGGVLLSGVVIAIQILVSGWDTFAFYFSDILPILAAEGQVGVIHSNNSVLGFAQRLFSSAPLAIPLIESPFLLSVTRYALTLLLIVPLLALRRTRDTSAFDLEYSLALLTALLLGSTLGIHGMLSALLPLVVLWRGQWLPKAGLYLIIFLIDVHLFMVLGYLVPGSGNQLHALLLSGPFFGLMLLWAFLIKAHLQQSRQNVEAPSANLNPFLTEA